MDQAKKIVLHGVETFVIGEMAGKGETLCEEIQKPKVLFGLG